MNSVSMRAKIRFAVFAAAMFLSASAFAGEGVLRIYVTRHAQRGPRRQWPEADREAVMPGEMINGVLHRPAGDSITPLGVRQAKALGECLRRHGFAGAIYASPNFRTMQTAVCAAEMLGTNAVVIPEPLLLNGSGRLTPGSSPKFDELAKRFPGRVVEGDPLPLSRRLGDWVLPLPGMDDFFEAFIAAHPQGEFLLVGHSSTLPKLLAAIEEHVKDDSLKLARSVANCCLFVYDFDKDGVVVDSDILNDEFLTPEMLTSNFGPGKTPPRRKEKAAAAASEK